MKTLKILHWIIDLFLLAIAIIVLIGFILFFVSIGDPEFRFISDISKYESFGKKTIYILGLILSKSTGILFIITIFNLRMIISRFEKGFNFDVKTRKYFKRAGWITLAYGLIKLFLADYWESFLGEKGFSLMSFNSEFVSFSSYMFFIVLGLFFIYLAKVFEKSEQFQKETELTI